MPKLDVFEEALLAVDWTIFPNDSLACCVPGDLLRNTFSNEFFGSVAVRLI